MDKLPKSKLINNGHRLGRVSLRAKKEAGPFAEKEGEQNVKRRVQPSDQIRGLRFSYSSGGHKKCLF